MTPAQQERKRATDRKAARKRAAIARGEDPSRVTGDPAPLVRISLPRARVPSLPLALCVGADPDLFFSDSAGDIEAAKAICRSCPAIAECLRGAQERREVFGVWGGTDFNRDHDRQESAA